MHDKPLSKFTGRLVRRRPGVSRPAPERVGPDTYGLDEDKTLRFAADRLGPEEEQRLAEEVAELLPLGWSLSPRAKERLYTVSSHLGGEPQLLDWLDRHPGLPRLTARLTAMTGNLDRYSDDPSVVEAVRAARAEGALPAELEELLPPQTDEETLSDLAYRIDSLLFERRTGDAARLALTAADWLRTAARQAPSRSPMLDEMAEFMAHLHEDVRQAGAAV
ncbi:hypothetical protein ACH4KU_21920 [Streptomyces althioticus]|uniref:hypothetical protein n=1 Tax=Streptomyces althioticus TaxID=83380 RepID=UPI0037B35A09